MAKTPTSASLLRKLREDTGQSLRETATDLGVAASHLSRLERGEKSPSEALSEKVAEYYGVDRDLVYLNDGRIPSDVLEILKSHPEVLTELRQRYSNRRSDDLQ